jgi:FkbM family methyltransferase
MKASETLTELGLRGLGVNVSHDRRFNGEARFLRIALPLLGKCTCADVGANIGDYTALLAKCGAAEVYAFEPVPSTFEWLKKNIRKDPGYHAIYAAVGEYEGDVEIQRPIGEKSTLASRDITATDVASAPIERSITRITTLDQFCAAHNLHFDLVKIDVEGFELEVIKGAAETLVKSPPSIIQFEFNTHHRRRRQNLGDFHALLKSYSLFRLTIHAIRPIQPEHYLSNIYALQNVVAILKDDQRVRRLLC